VRGFPLGYGLIIAVAGCGAANGTAADMLKRGSPDVCVAKEVKSLWVDKLLTHYPGDGWKEHNAKVALFDLSFETATVAEVKKNEGSVVCEAELAVSLKSDPTLKSTRFVTYEVRPVIGKAGEVVLVAADQGATRWAGLVVDNLAPSTESK
jgi:hypothetical protein